MTETIQKCRTGTQKHTHTHIWAHDVLWGRCLNDWHMACEIDKAQPPVDAPFDRGYGSADKFSGQWQLLLKNGHSRSNQSLELTDFWTRSSDHRLNSLQSPPRPPPPLRWRLLFSKLWHLSLKSGNHSPLCFSINLLGDTRPCLGNA